MAYRYIELEVKVAAMKECLHLENVSEVAEKYGIDTDTVRHIYKQKILTPLRELVDNKRPGPKPKERETEKGFEEKGSGKHAKDGRPDSCPQCGSSTVWKNGTYMVINWLIF